MVAYAVGWMNIGKEQVMQLEIFFQNRKYDNRNGKKMKKARQNRMFLWHI